MRITDWSSDWCSSDLTRSRSYCSINYGIDQYAANIVQPLDEACAETALPQPRIITECGRAMTAHHALLVANASEVRSEARRVWRACVSTCRSRGSPYPSQKSETDNSP